MAFFINSDLHKKNLSILAEQPNAICESFLKLAREYIIDGRNEQQYATIADKLKTEPEIIERAIESLVCLLIDNVKRDITEEDFAKAISKIYLPDYKILWEFVQAEHPLNEKILEKLEISDLRFRDLEWRVEAKIASRSLLNQAVPKITMKLYLDSEVINEHKDKLHTCNPGTSKKEILCQTDLTNLTHIISELEQALLESKTHRTRNLVKVFQN